MSKIHVPLDVAQHVLWHFGDTNLGLQPGTFTERLLLTMSAADQGNLDKLSSAFPEYAAAFVAVAREPWGLEWLRKLVKAAEAGAAEEPDLLDTLAGVEACS